MKKLFSLAFMLVIVIYSCKHEVIAPADGTAQDSTATGGTGGTGGNSGSGSGSSLVCFETDILPIFTGNCTDAGCHNATDKTEGYILTSYSGIRYSNNDGIVPGKPDESEIYEAITDDDVSDRMPYNRAPLSTQQIALIRRWIIEGAQNTTNCGTSNCNTNLFTYSGAVKPIIEKHCKGCHSGTATPARPNLTTYAGIKDVAQPNGRLLGAINHAPGFKPMPQVGPKLSDCEITQITKWVNAGAPNN